MAFGGQKSLGALRPAAAEGDDESGLTRYDPRDGAEPGGGDRQVAAYQAVP